MIKILCISDYFYPGFLGGGPITTLVNIRRRLIDKVEMAVFTRDRDLGGQYHYEGVVSDKWTFTEEGPVYYASSSEFKGRSILRAAKNGKYDAVYLNSFFSFHGSISPYLMLKVGFWKKPIIIAPRGEFSPGALAIKRWKKTIFILFARLCHFYGDVFWHASTEREAADITSVFPRSFGRIFVAGDPVAFDEAPSLLVRPERSGLLRAVFISRISPKKNLDGLLNILSSSRSSIQLDIFGPIEDTDYWNLCLNLIDQMPENISVHYRGALTPLEIAGTFSDYDVFLFPTHGENFGHVIFEALSSGTPVLISDQTPWEADSGGGVTVLPLDNPENWTTVLDQWASFNPAQKLARRQAAVAFIERYIAEDLSWQMTLQMFQDIVDQSKPSP